MKIKLTDEQLDMIANRVATKLAPNRGADPRRNCPRRPTMGVDLGEGVSYGTIVLIKKVADAAEPPKDDARLLTTLSDLRTLHTGVRSGTMGPKEVDRRIATLIDEIENSMAER